MSSQNNKNRYGGGFVSATGGANSRGPPGPSFTKGYGTGLVSLGTAKTRTGSSLTERKLSVPKPVNLPSLRKENAGNDPNTQLVPSGGTGGWQKPDSKEDSVDETAPILAAGSSWASGAQTSSGVPSWQPPQPFPVAAATATAPRSLNPHEYPSLSAAASTKQTTAPKQPVSHLPSAGSQGGGNWDEDERKPVFGAHTRIIGESWADSRPEDEDKPSRPSWERDPAAINGRPEWRPPGGEGNHRGGYGDDHWTPRGAGAVNRGGYPPRPSFGVQDRFREVEDPTLFPPPPPPRQPPPPPPPRAGAEQTREEAEAEKQAFEAEIDRVIEDERRRKRELQQEAARAHEAEMEAERKARAEKAAAKPPPPPPPQTEEQHAAAAEAAKQKAIALRKQREEEAREAENRRKEAAAAKLKELEERIARKKAELEAASTETGEGSKATAEGTLAEIEAAVVEAVEISAVGAAESAAAVAEATAAVAASEGEEKAAEGGVGVTRVGSKGSLQGNLSSVGAEAGSSVGAPETVAELQALESTVTPEAAPTTVESHESWSRPQASQPKHIWQRKDREASRAEPEVGTSHPPEKAATPRLSTADSGAAALFAESSGFGPALVATSLGISKEELAAAQNPGGKNAEKEPSGHKSWRAIIKGPGAADEPSGGREEEARAPEKAEEALQEPQVEAVGGGRGRGRGGRGKRDQSAKEDRQDAGGRGERGKGKERGKGRGKGRGRQDAASKDDVSVTSAPSVATEGAPQSGTQNQNPPQRQPKQRGQRGKGPKEQGEGRGRGSRSAVVATAAPVAAAVAPGGSADQDVPPGIGGPTIVQSLPEGSPRAAPADPKAKPGNAYRGDWTPVSKPLDPQNLPPLSNLGKPPGALSPTLDPLAPRVTGPDSRSDRAVDRPKSAVGAVGRPKSSKPESLLPNGMPLLPSDLSLDGPRTSEAGKSSGLSFGFQAPQHQPEFSPGPLPGVFFSGSGQHSNPWQPPAPASQKNANDTVVPFHASGASSSTFSQGSQSQSQSQSLQFGAFASHQFPQFGQLTGSDFGQSPFIRTGKQPDWSTGPISQNPSTSSALKSAEATPGGLPIPPGQGFSLTPGMDAVLPQGNLQKRGPQTAPGPPGLHRVPQGQSNFQAASLVDSASQQPHPPGLKQGPHHHQGSFQAPSAVGGHVHGPRQSVAVDFVSGSSQGQYSLQQGPPGIGARPPAVPRDQAATLPDDVYETSDIKALHVPAPSNLNGQVRRGGGEGRGGRGGRNVGRAVPANRGGRNYGRGGHLPGGRGAPPNPPGPPGVSYQHMQGGSMDGGNFPQGRPPMGAFGPPPQGLNPSGQQGGGVQQQLQASKRGGGNAGKGRGRAQAVRITQEGTSAGGNAPSGQGS